MTAPTALLRPLVYALGRNKLSILIYHRVHRETDPIFPGEVDAQRFDAHLSWLTGLFNVIPLSQAVEQLRTGTLPARAACITFDDGYADNAEVALPILKRHNASATFFVSTGFLDGGRMWNDTIIESVRRASGSLLDLTSLDLGQHDISTPAAQRRAINSIIGVIKYLPQEQRMEKVDAVAGVIGERLPDDLMMRSEQVRLLADSNMIVGAHTVSHPILARITAADAKREIVTSRQALETITGKPITLFAYPNGKPGEDYAAEHVAMVRDLGFDAAVCTSWGAASAEDDFFQLPRFLPWDKTALRFSLRLTSNLLKRGSRL
ncbi:MAG: polysaccharide deacetylase family protein [Pseudomonadota bacterium]